MSLIRINPQFVYDVNSNYKKTNEQIKAKQAELIEKIDSIREVYSGQDAEILITKYKNRVNKLSRITNTIDRYNKYFDIITESYKSNLDNAVKNLNQLNTNEVPFESVVSSGMDLTGGDNNV